MTPFIEGVGRRKTSHARVRIWDVTGAKARKEARLDSARQAKEPLVNTKKLNQYFPLAELQRVAVEPLAKLGLSEVGMEARVKGGGIHSQAEAIRHGLARALLKKDEAHKPLLRAHGFLTRDARMKERRKFGLKKARRAPQWAKR